MATVSALILKSDLKKDGTWNVKIRVWHKGQPKYIPTEHFVTAKQLKGDGSIKDPIILQLLNQVLDDYRIKISRLGPRLKHFTVASLAAYLESGDLVPEGINVISFGRERIGALRKAKRNSSAGDMRKVVNSLEDYYGSSFVPISEITSKMLEKYEAYLRSKRTITRLNQFKRPGKRVTKGLGDAGIHNHMRDLRILFNAVKDHYNDEEKGILIIKHYPFKKYKVVKKPPTKKKKLTVEQMIAIRDCKVPPGSRAELVRDLFMLSFYLCGTNAADLYELSPEIQHVARYEYNRAKTRSRRTDNAFISISIPPEAQPLLEKYAGKLQLRYSRFEYLDTAISKGMRKIGEITNIPGLDFYHTRHTFADLARNICRFSKDDVALTMNHVDNRNKTTDIYISANWDIVDEVQEGVLSLLRQKPSRIIDDQQHVEPCNSCPVNTGILLSEVKARLLETF